MKRGAVILLLILLLPFACASNEWMFRAAEVELTNDVHMSIVIDRESDLSRVAFVAMNTTLFPKTNTRQKVSYQYTSPNASMEDDLFKYKWLLPQNTLNFSVYSTITNVHQIKHITKRVAFPLEGIPKEAQRYLGVTDIITSNHPDVSRLASELAQGEDDLYRLACKIGTWIHANVNYSTEGGLGTGTKSAAWTLANKKGACDEQAGLFIALCRALNIPARYVVGQAFSNMAGQPWQNHGWVEVYFPGSGWIPFDPSFGEMGWIDNSHIEYYASERVVTSPAMLSYEGSDVNISIASPRIVTTLLSKTGDAGQLYSIEVKPYKETVGFGSYNYIEVVFNNSNTFYVADLVHLVPTEGLSYKDSMDRYIMLGPKETAREYFIVRAPANMSERYFYTYPAKISTLRGYNASSSFQSKQQFEELSYDRVLTLATRLRLEESQTNKTVVKEMELGCVLVGGPVYVNDEAVFNCTVANQGNSVLNSLKLCLEEDCQVFDLNIGEKKDMRIARVYAEPGQVDALFTVEGGAFGKSQALTINVLAIPGLKIKDLKYPEQVSYKEDFVVSFLLDNPTRSEVSEVTMNVSYELINDGFQVTGYLGSRLLTVSGKARDLKVGDNVLKISVEYKDLLGRPFSITEEAHIKLGKLSVVQRISLWFRGVFNKLDSLFVKQEPQ